MIIWKGLLGLASVEEPKIRWLGMWINAGGTYVGQFLRVCSLLPVFSRDEATRRPFLLRKESEFHWNRHDIPLKWVPSLPG